MGAKLFTVLAALSLMLEAALAVSVVRSYWVEDVLGLVINDDERFISHSNDFTLSMGELRFRSRRVRSFERSWHDRFARSPGWEHVAVAPDAKPFGRPFGERPGEWEVLGVGYKPSVRSGQHHQAWEHEAVLPPWLLLLARILHRRGRMGCRTRFGRG